MVFDNNNAVDILGIRIDNLTFPEVMDAIRLMIKRQKPSLICTANANHVRIARNDPEFAQLYREADLVTADGMSIMWAAKLLGRPLREKVSGSDLVPEICKRSAEYGFKIYMLGAEEGVAKKAKELCEKLYPGVQIVGYYSPTREEIYDNERSKQIVGWINESNANILLVAFSSPLQEKWVIWHRAELRVPVSIGVGGTIDYLANIIKRPPVVIQRFGLEWAFRTVQNPCRYLKRYLLDLKFYYYLFVELIRRKTS